MAGRAFFFADGQICDRCRQLGAEALVVGQSVYQRAAGL